MTCRACTKNSKDLYELDPLTIEGAEAFVTNCITSSMWRDPTWSTPFQRRGPGDLSENAEYDAAKERQGFIEGRIAELEAKLSTAQIIDPTTLEQDGRVVFGVTVTMEDLDSGEKMTYKIVGDDEADVKLHKISISSPIARALIGKSVGDVSS